MPTKRSYPAPSSQVLHTQTYKTETYVDEAINHRQRNISKGSKGLFEKPLLKAFLTSKNMQAKVWIEHGFLRILKVEPCILKNQVQKKHK